MGFITLPTPQCYKGSLKQEHKSPLHYENYCLTRSRHDKPRVSESWYVRMLWHLAQVPVTLLRLAWDSPSCFCTCCLNIELPSSFTPFTQTWPFKWEFLMFLSIAIWSVLNEEAGVRWLLASPSPCSPASKKPNSNALWPHWAHLPMAITWALPASLMATLPPPIILLPEGRSPPSQVTILF